MATTPTPLADPQVAPLQPVAPSPEPQPAPAAPAADPWFLEAPTGTRYRTAEDAVRGVAEKDATIDRYKQQLAQAQAALGATPQAPPQPTYLELLEQAVQPGGNRAAFQDAIQADIRRQAQEIADQMLGQFNPLLQNAGLNRAVEIASTGPNGDPNIPAFVRSETFRTLSKNYPVLAEAMTHVNNPRFATEQLPQIILLAYHASRGLTSAPATAPAQAAPPQQRSLTPTATPAPAAPVSGGPLTREQRAQLYNQFSNVSTEDWRTAIQNQGQ